MSAEEIALMKIAAVTMCYNEKTFLPLWISHYGKYCGHENLFLIDNGSDDGSTQSLEPINIIHEPRGEFCEIRRMELVSRIVLDLHGRYDAVLFSDTDELVTPNPAKYGGLREFLEKNPEPAFRSVGLNIIQENEDEPGIDPARPILRQRGFAQFAHPYCKPLLARRPLRWSAGFHDCRENVGIHPDLILFHLKTMDKAIALQSLAKNQDITWSPRSLASGEGRWLRLQEKELIRKCFPPIPEASRASAPTLSEFLLGFPADRTAYRALHKTIIRIDAAFADCL